VIVIVWLRVVVAEEQVADPAHLVVRRLS